MVFTKESINSGNMLATCKTYIVQKHCKQFSYVRFD